MLAGLRKLPSVQATRTRPDLKPSRSSENENETKNKTRHQRPAPDWPVTTLPENTAATSGLFALIPCEPHKHRGPSANTTAAFDHPPCPTSLLCNTRPHPSCCPECHSLIPPSQPSVSSQSEARSRLVRPPLPLARPSPVHPLSIRSQQEHQRAATTEGESTNPIQSNPIHHKNPREKNNTAKKKEKRRESHKKRYTAMSSEERQRERERERGKIPITTQNTR